MNQLNAHLVWCLVPMKCLLLKLNQVKAEAVDRSSVYGEEEEGWEDAVAVDVNPTYDYEG